MTELAAPSNQVPAEHECQIVPGHVGPICVVRVNGRLDCATAAQFHDRMCDEYTDAMVIFDLSHSVSMDSAGAGVLQAPPPRPPGETGSSWSSVSTQSRSGCCAACSWISSCLFSGRKSKR
jgi:hypothetical protein